MPANLENSEVATGLKKVSFHSNPKEGQCQRMFRFLYKMRIPDHLTCLLRNLYAGQQTIVRTGHETTDWFQIRKGARQGCILSPCLLFNLYAEYIIRNTGLDEVQPESRFLWKISITSDMQMIPLLWQKVKKN